MKGSLALVALGQGEPFTQTLLHSAAILLAQMGPAIGSFFMSGWLLSPWFGAPDFEFTCLPVGR